VDHASRSLARLQSPSAIVGRGGSRTARSNLIGFVTRPCVLLLPSVILSGGCRRRRISAKRFVLCYLPFERF
jgi:hypothetical protein